MMLGMRLTVAAIGLALVGVAQPGSEPVERATLRLHYVQKPIGYERYEIVRSAEALQLSSDVDFTDRGGRPSCSKPPARAIGS
jgi:hypothetical protein